MRLGPSWPRSAHQDEPEDLKFPFRSAIHQETRIRFGIKSLRPFRFSPHFVKAVSMSDSATLPANDPDAW